MTNEVFNITPNKLGDLLSDIRNGKLGLPDLQRPFVWSNTKVRDLFDSMFKGYPVGYIMVWDSPSDFDDKKSGVGTHGKSYAAPKELIIDGQQRLTALVSAMYNVEIIDKNFEKRTIKIAFNPIEKRFEVSGKAETKTPEWVYDISELFISNENHKYISFKKQYIKKLNDYYDKKERSQLTEDEEEQIENQLKNLLDLESYTIPTLGILSKADEEDVAEIFVRVNSGGQTLNEDNFILTIISVYDAEMRDIIDAFCENCRIPAAKTSYNNIIEVDPSHLVRIAVGVGFKRARLRYAYKILRGKDLESGKSSEDIRANNFNVFRSALNLALDLNNWHAFLNTIAEAGYVSSKIISSKNAVIYTYALYLMAKYEYKLSAMELRRTIGKWFFMASVTYFYTGSYESAVERQFADLKDITSAQDFIRYIDSQIASRLTDDFFHITLTQELQTAGATPPSWYAYLAAQNILQHPMLFSSTMLATHLIPGTSGNKNAVDKHHIFPKSYLVSQGITSERDTNQVANFTYLDYATNIAISDKAPWRYCAEFAEKMGRDQYQRACAQHALPEGFETMKYFEFLKRRRSLMAQTIKDAYQTLNEHNG